MITWPVTTVVTGQSRIGDTKIRIISVKLTNFSFLHERWDDFYLGRQILCNVVTKDVTW